MNVTELARILKVTPQELRDNLPLVGFDIGQKAIKINYSVAQKIIREWPMIKRKLEEIRNEEKKEKTENTSLEVEKKTVTIPSFITVRDFSSITGAPINKILAELMKNGIFTSMNEKIDYDTAWLVGSELGFEVVKNEEKDEVSDRSNQKKLEEIIMNEESEDLLPRAPVIVVMGHVDHGKTKLLDAIRTTNVVEGEAGGITQHIGAYQTIRNNKAITFIDTPGHEAFTAMRSRGAKIADVAILVVAADDGVKPQTTEAFRIIEAAKIPYIVAINKIDKPDANIDKTKQELSTQLNIIPEDWGGKIPCLPISAKEGTGIDNILDTILLLADVEAKSIVANPNASAVGTIIESHVDKGAGPVATLLVQNGTLNVGDQLVFNHQYYGKVRSLKNYKGEIIGSAGPSTPVEIIGLKLLPEVGDILNVGEGEKIKLRKLRKADTDQFQQASQSETENAQKLNLIIKSDVLGSAEAIEESLMKINSSRIIAKILVKGLGNITENDVTRAEASNAIIIGFNIKIPTAMEELAREKNVEIKTFSIIYKLIEFVKERMQELVKPEIRRVDLGRAKVLAVFRTEKQSQIIGARIIDGIAEAGCIIEVLKNKELAAQGLMKTLQSGKLEVKDVETGEECGILYEGRPVIEVDDLLVFYKEEKIFEKI